MPNLLRAALAAVAATALLAGCSAVPDSRPTSTASTRSVQSQTPTEACLALAASLGPSALGDLASVLSDLSSDPAKALTALTSFADNLKSAAATVTNPKVKAEADKLSKELKDLISQVQKAIKNPKKATRLGADVQKVRAELTTLGTLCTGL